MTVHERCETKEKTRNSTVCKTLMVIGMIRSRWKNSVGIKYEKYEGVGIYSSVDEVQKDRSR